MTTEITIIFAKLILSSALLLAFYFFVLQDKASYRMQRLYLLLIPFASIMASGFSFEVYKPKANIIEMDKAEVQEYHAANAHTGYHIEASRDTDLQELGINPLQDLFVVTNNMAEEIFVIIIGLYAIAAVSVIMLLIALFNIFKIYKINKHQKAIKTADGYLLVCSEEIKTAFSFGNTIYMPSGMESDKADYILMHEKAHIANKHYIDVWIVEVTTRLLWFNPFMWSVRKHLRNVHEYEADRCVIDAGANILRYQTILLEEVAEDSVIIANGFNHSFIRRRFIEMKKSAVGTLGKLGKVSTGVWVLLMLCAFTFTIGEAETIIKVKAPSNSSIRGGLIVTETSEETQAAEVDSSISPLLGETEGALGDTKETTHKDDTRPSVASDGNPNYYELPANTNSRIPYEGLSIQRNANNTIITVVGTPESNDEYFWFGGEQTYIEDLETGDHYKARRPLNMPVFTGFHAIDMKGKTFALQMEFPPLPDEVKTVRMWHLCSWLKYKLYSPIKIKDYEVK